MAPAVFNKPRNVYKAAAGEYRRNQRFNKDAIRASPHVKRDIDSKHCVVYLDRKAPDYEDMFDNPGTAIPPDEVLASAYPLDCTVPIKPRHEFPPENQLPSSDLCKAIHYYASTKYSKGDSPHSKKMLHSMDESALLAFGKLVEEWIDETIDPNTARGFLQRSDPAKRSGINWQGLGEDDDDEGDDPVLSSDLLSSELGGGDDSQSDESA